MAKPHDDLGWLEHLQLRAAVAAEDQVVVLKQIALAIEKHDEQHAPWCVLVKGGPKSGPLAEPLAEQPTVVAEEDGAPRRVPSTDQYATFVREVRRVLTADRRCGHTDDLYLWQAVCRVGNDTFGVGWVTETDG